MLSRNTLKGMLQLRRNINPFTVKLKLFIGIHLYSFIGIECYRLPKLCSLLVRAYILSNAIIYKQ